MKLLRTFSLFAFIAILALPFASCSEESIIDPPAADKPNPPTELMATSMNDSTVILKWTVSTSSHDSLKYILTVSENSTEVVTLTIEDAGTTTATVNNLTEGTEYTFELIAEFDGGEQSGKAVVTWSPASRFNLSDNDIEIKLWSFQSNFGSGLDLFNGDPDNPDPDFDGPEVLVIGSKDRWDIGMSDKGQGLSIGSASKIDVGPPNTPTHVTEVSSKYFEENSLDDVFGSVALDDAATHAYSENTFDLLDASLDKTKNFIFIARTQVAGQTGLNYAKIMVKRGADGEFLQTDDGDQYIELVISYQRKAGVPYAGVKKPTNNGK